MLTAGFGGATPVTGGGFQITITNAKNVKDLKSWGFEGGGSALVAGLGYVGSSSYEGVCISVGASNVLLPFEVHGYVTFTVGHKISAKEITDFKSQLSKNLRWLNNNMTSSMKKSINKLMGIKYLTV